MIQDTEYEKAWDEEPTPLVSAVAKAGAVAEKHPDEYVQAHRDLEASEAAPTEGEADDENDPDEDLDNEDPDEREQRLANEAAMKKGETA